MHLSSDRAHPTCRPPSGAMCAAGPPLCGCGVKLAQLKTPALRSSWASREGVSWSESGRGPYFHFCQSCHLGIWPEDARPPVGNRFCRPGQPSWPGKGDRKRALLGTPPPYSQHTVNIQSTYSQHTVNIQSTYSQHDHQTIQKTMVFLHKPAFLIGLIKLI